MADEDEHVVQTKDLLSPGNNGEKSSDNERTSVNLLGNKLKSPNLQVKRSQTAGVDELNIFSRVLGSPFEGLSNADLDLHHAAAKDYGIAHRKLSCPDDNTEVNKRRKQRHEGLQKQIAQNQSLIIEQQKTISTLINKVDTLTSVFSDKSKNVDQSAQESVINDGPYEVISDDSSDSEYVSDTDSHVSAVEITDRQANDGDISESRQLLQQLSGEFVKQEPVGEKIDQYLAEVVDSGIKQPIDRKTAAALCAKQIRPEKCALLMVPKINKELWVSSSLHKPTKEKDKKFQTTQGYITAGMIPLVKLMDSLLKTNQYKEFEMAKDSFQLLAYAHRDVTNLRRQQIKPGINSKYQQLCHDNTPLTGNLLGDDLEKQLKTMDDMRKIGSTVACPQQNKASSQKHSSFKRDYHVNKPHPRSHHPYQRGSSYNTNETQSSAPFLGKKTRQHMSGQKMSHKSWHKQKK